MTQSARRPAIRYIRQALCCLAILAASTQSTPAAAGQDSSSSGAQNFSIHLVETPFMKIGIHAAPWLLQVIADMQAKQRPRLDLYRVALFDDKAGSRYLVVFWDRHRAAPDEDARNVVDFYRVLESSNGRIQLRLVDHQAAHGIDLLPPSGVVAFPGEPPIAVLRYDIGGTGIGGTSTAILEMGPKIVTIDPRPGGIQQDAYVDDVDGDGKYELLVVNDGWAHYFSMASAAGPEFWVVFDRVNGKFEPACRKHRQAYRTWIASNLKTAEAPGLPPPDRAEFYAGALLYAAQIGDIAEARRILEMLMAEVDKFDPWPSWIPSKAAVRQDFEDLLAKAERVADMPCVVNATGIKRGRYDAEGG